MSLSRWEGVVRLRSDGQRVVPILVVLSVVVSLGAVPVAAAPTALSGSGTLQDPYVVTTVEELQLVQNDLDAHYVLGNDIDATATAAWNSGAGFDPIGDSSTGFTGSFDGQGYTIDGLTIDRPTENFVGLFGWNEGLVVGSSVGASVTGNGGVGGLVGYNGGTVSESSATGTVSGTNTYVGGLVGYNNGLVTESSATGTVSSDDSLVGGLVGINDDTIERSSATGSVSGNRYVGGLVGENPSESTIDQSSASGDVSGTQDVGGLVGSSRGAVTGSSASGTVSGDAFVGGLVGTNAGTVSESSATGSVSGAIFVGGLVGVNSETVNESSATGTVSGDDYVGGLVGYNYGGVVSESYATGAVSGSIVGGLVGYNDGGTVSESYWDTETSNQTTSDGGTGLTTAEITGTAAETNMTGFDFASTWVLTDSYPRLAWSLDALTLETSESVLLPGEETQATVTATFSDGSTETATTVATYASDDETVATVDASGLVIGVGGGTTNVSASLGALTESVSLRVIIPGDIVVQSVSIDDKRIIAGEGATIRATVENVGETETTEPVRLFFDGGLVATQSVTLAGGSSQTVVFDRTVNQPDGYSVVVETAYAGVLRVLRPADVQVVTVDLEETGVEAGVTVTAVVTVTNTGDTRGPITVTLTADGTAVDSRTASIQGGETTALRVRTTFDQPGTYALAVNGIDAGTVTVGGDGSGTEDDAGWQAILAGDDDVFGFQEVLVALELFTTGQPVPGTDHVLTFADVLEVIDRFNTGTPV